MVVHKGHSLAQRMLGNRSIRVQQQHIFALCLPDGDVVGACEAQVLVVGDKPDPHIASGQDGHRIVRRGIVDDEHLAVDARERLFNADETLLQIATYVVADDND